MVRIKLREVYYIPKEIEKGTLYVSEEFGVATHLCPCGCGHKVVTPIGPTDWSFKSIDGRATLYPSIGNWQIPCRSHYWITNGLIEWSYPWTEEEIEAGREAEEKRAKKYYEELDSKRKKKSNFVRILNKIFNR